MKGGAVKRDDFANRRNGIVNFGLYNVAKI